MQKIYKYKICRSEKAYMKTLKLMIFTYKQLPDTNCNLRKLLAQVDHNLKNYFHRREKPLSE